MLLFKAIIPWLTLAALCSSGIASPALPMQEETTEDLNHLTVRSNGLWAGTTVPTNRLGRQLQFQYQLVGSVEVWATALAASGQMNWAAIGATWNSIQGFGTTFTSSIGNFAAAQSPTTLHPSVYISQQIAGATTFISAQLRIDGPPGMPTSWDNIVDSIGGYNNLQTITFSILYDVFSRGAISGNYNIVNRWGGLIAQVAVGLQQQVGMQ